MERETARQLLLGEFERTQDVAWQQRKLLEGTHDDLYWIPLGAGAHEWSGCQVRASC